MAPKGRPGVSISDLQQEDIIQAVVFADSFNRNFVPISDNKPRALFPVANTPLLDYTLEFLCAGGVQEIFVVCCHLANQIKEHLKKSRWNGKSCPCKVVPIVADRCISMGDALRDIDAKQYIRSDFVLVYGDLISNIKLQNIIKEHKLRREKDKSVVMTMVFRQAPPGHFTRSSQDDIFVAIDNQTQNVIHYQKVSENENCKHFEVPVEILTEHKDIQLRYDLMDADISICSPQVAQLFTDNFDYETRDSFVKGILINEEIMGNTIQMHVVTDAYAARVSNLHMYDAVTQDVLNRWTFPFVPDSCYRNNNDNISFLRHNTYLSKDVTLARDCNLIENVLLGSGTKVDSCSKISHSVIGQHCKIGKNVKMTGCYLWDNVTVADNCNLESVLLCDDVTVHENVNLHPGCVLNSKVIVGPNADIKEGTVAVASLHDDFGNEDDIVDGGCEPVFGSKAMAYVYKDTEADESDIKEVNKPFWDLAIQSDSSDDDFSDDVSERGSSPASFPPDVAVCYTEMLDTIQRSIDENISSENLILEINSLKHAYNISIKELTTLVVQVILEQPFGDHPCLAGADALRVLKSTLKKHQMVLQNYIKNEELQLQCLRAIEKFGFASPQNMSLVMTLIHFLYDSEILVEQSIFKWFYQSAKARQFSGGDGEDIENKQKEIRKQVAPLVKWLEEADEESSDGE